MGIDQSGTLAEATIDEQRLNARAANVLCQARMILREGRWCQNYTAVDFKGKELPHPAHPSAVCYCVGGAIDLAAHRLYGEDVIMRGPVSRRADALFATLDRRAAARIAEDDALAHVVKFNDEPGRTLQQILERIDAAVSAEAA
jgi:hypothetical protein